MWNQTHAVGVYAHTAAVTAGHLKAYQILLEKAVFLTRLARRGNMNARDQAQDIVAQVQSGMNLHFEAARQFYEVLGYVWDALEWNGPVYYDRAEDLLRQMREVVLKVQRLA